MDKEKRVTIIVPVYGDWATLNECLESLKLYLAPRHMVMLVNDMGPEWEMLEKSISRSISGYKNFVYFRNSENIGFVRTCNKAVFEYDRTANDIMLLNSDTQVTENFLEEMLEVLYLDNKNGVVCPRSNNATFLSVPFKNNKNIKSDPDLGYKVYMEIKNKIPRYMEIPTGVGFAFLVRRILIDKFGLFDEAYGLGYNEENDFCMRIKRYGYLTIAANQAFVFHYEGRSFGDRKQKLELVNSSRLLKRYPDYWELNEDYINNKINPIDYFADLLVDSVYDKKKIILVFLDKKLKSNKDFNFYKELSERLKQNYEVTIFLNKRDMKKFISEEDADNVITKNSLNQTYHMALVVGNTNDLNINRLCLKTFQINENEALENIILDIDKEAEREVDIDELKHNWYDSEVKGRKSIYYHIKKYLYTNHIWLFIIWNKLNKRIQRK